MGEIHVFFVLALTLVWFAGATPELLVKNLSTFVRNCRFSDFDKVLT